MPKRARTDAQKLTEFICHRIAEKQREKLPKKFWMLPKWKAIYKKQIIAANSLLKLYSIDIILQALNSKYGKKIYSLKFWGLHDLCEEQVHLNKKNTIRKNKKQEYIPSSGDTFRQSSFSNKKNKLSGL